MKKIILGLCLVVVPAFSSTTSCPQGGLLSSVIGCQTFDAMLGSVSTASLASSTFEPPAVSVTPSASPFSELLVSPLQTSAPAAASSPFSVPSSSSLFAAPSFSPEAFIPSTSFQSLPTISYTSNLGNSIGGSVSLGSVILPSQFNVGLPFGFGVTPGNIFDPVTSSAFVTPEASSVAMIGTGLLFLILVSARKRKKQLS
jgi:hypothetical protein